MKRDERVRTSKEKMFACLAQLREEKEQGNDVCMLSNDESTERARHRYVTLHRRSRTNIQQVQLRMEKQNSRLDNGAKKTEQRRRQRERKKRKAAGEREWKETR